MHRMSLDFGVEAFERDSPHPLIVIDILPHELIEHEQVLKSLAGRKLLRQELQRIALKLGKHHLVFLLIFRKERMVGAKRTICEDQKRIDRTVPVEFQKRRNPAELLS